MTLQALFDLSVSEFFQFVKTIAYGYRDTRGAVHVLSEVMETVDASAWPYAYSTPQDILETSVGWCWDVCQLIKAYCQANGMPCRTYYLEYFDPAKGQHQTHAQCFAHDGGAWVLCPDNTDPEPFGTRTNASLEALVKELAGDFFDFCTAQFGSLDPACQLVKAFDLQFPAGMGDEALMAAIRAF